MTRTNHVTPLKRANKSCDRLQIDLKDQQVHHVFDGFLEILLNLLAHRDFYTYLHSLRVAELSRRIGQRLQLAKDEIQSLEHGGLIHDIGKMSIPDDVLLKPGMFTVHDRHIMQTHPLIGAQLFQGKGIDERMVNIALMHHERLDGSGYPNGLAAESIPIHARIVAVADIHEALIAQRPYKPNRSREESLELLRLDVRDGKLDAEVVSVLTEITSEWNPLTINGRTYPRSLAQLEDFRNSTYFREPLSEFYNYRYLFSLGDSLQGALNKSPYTLFALCFRNLKKLNRTKGYIETDRILDLIGERLQNRISGILPDTPQTGPPMLLFLKKGADYIIYSRFDKEGCRRLYRLIQKSITEAQNDWNIECDCHRRRFENGAPFVEALDLLLNNESDISHAAMP